MRNLLVLLICISICRLQAVNVRDFGAVGDGKTDDTEAIQQAVSFLASKIKLERFRIEDGWYRGSSETHVDELYFPRGTYKITRSIFAHGSVVWRGEKGSVITLADPTQDILYCRIYRRAVFSGLEFAGGKTQIQLWSRNWNASSVHIRNCVFRDSAAPAVRSVSMREYTPPEDYKKGWKAIGVNMIPPHEVLQVDGKPRLTAPPVRNMISWYSSNIIYIRECEFLNCASPFEFNNDGTLIDRCRIVANPEISGALIYVGIGPAPNMLAIWDSTFEAPASRETQSWFRNIGFHFSCNNTVFKSARPMVIMEQNTGKIPSHSIPGSVTFNRCTFDFPAAPEALIVMRRVPCVLKMIDNRSTVQVPLLKDMVKPDAKYFERDSFQGHLKGIPWSTAHKYNVIVHGNKNIAANIPETMKRFCYPDDPMLHDNVPLRPEIPLPQQELSAADFGVVADGKTDNSPALAQALLAAAKERKTLVLPAGKIRLASTVKLPRFASLRGEGMPVIAGDRRGDYDLFEVTDPEITAFNSIIFFQGKRFLNAKLGKKSRLISMQDCVFYDSSPYSVVMSGKNRDCQFRAAGCLWNGSGSVLTDCAYNEVVMCWMANNYWMDDQGFFIVRGGTALLRSPFFVPYVAKNIKRTNFITKKSKIWELGGNLRWVDNAGGNVYIHTPRGGGEAGGFSMLHQTAPGGKVYIEGGLGRFTNKDTRNVLFYAAAAPEKAVFAGIAGNPIHLFLGIRQKVWDAAAGTAPFPIKILGVMNPQDAPEKSR